MQSKSKNEELNHKIKSQDKQITDLIESNNKLKNNNEILNSMDKDNAMKKLVNKNEEFAELINNLTKD